MSKSSRSSSGSSREPARGAPSLLGADPLGALPGLPAGMDRRAALKVLGAAGAALVAGSASGCGDAPAQMPPDPDAERRAQGLTTLVVLCMENRSYDTFFGARSLLEGKPGDGLRMGMSNLDKSGRRVEIFRADRACVLDPPHGWASSHAQFASGMNSGFLTAYQDAQGDTVTPDVMGYQTRADLPVSYALADGGTTFDRWFCSLMGPTWPNRFYLHSAQSGGLTSNTLPTEGVTWPTVYHRLLEKNVPWAYYFGNLPFLALWRDLPSERMKRLEYDFFDDAAAGKLPPVTILEPAFGVNDDHPPLPTVFGQQLVAAVYGALAKSPQWPNVTLVVTYDEHGGFFDHVAPPTMADDRVPAGFGQLGFRVPTLVAGPYARAGHVSSVVHEHTSVIAHLSKLYGLAPLTARDAAAATLDDAIDAERLAQRMPAAPLTLPAVEIDESELSKTCKGITSLRALAGPQSELELAAAQGHLPASLDLRGRERDLLYAIGDRLDGFGMGRIVRGR